MAESATQHNGASPHSWDQSITSGAMAKLSSSLSLSPRAGLRLSSNHSLKRATQLFAPSALRSSYPDHRMPGVQCWISHHEEHGEHRVRAGDRALRRRH